MSSLKSAASPASPSASDASLVTPQSSATVITKSFRRLAKLLDALAAELPKDLPEEQCEAVSLDSLSRVAQKLSNTVTRYVLYVCREGTMQAVEKQTATLLDNLRAMIIQLRSLYPVASPLQRRAVIRAGKGVLGNLRELVQDIGKQVVFQIETQSDPESDPDSFHNNNHLSRLTARVWGACEGITRVPLTPMAATAAEMLQLTPLIADAAREIGEFVEGTHAEPRDDDDDDDDNEDDGDDGAVPALVPSDADAAAITAAAAEADADDGADGEAALRAELRAAAAAEAAEAAAAAAAEAEAADIYNERALAKSEYRWIPPSTALVRTIAETLAQAAGYINKMQPPLDLARGLPAGAPGPAAAAAVAAEAPLGDAGWHQRVAEAKAALDKDLEARFTDVEYISAKCDELGEALATPQELVRAARSAFFIVSRTSKVLGWMEQRMEAGWFDAAIAAKAKAKGKKKKAAANAAANAAAAAAGTSAAADASPEEAAGAGDVEESAAGVATEPAPVPAAAAPAPAPAPATEPSAPSSDAVAAATAATRVPWHRDPAVIPAIAAWQAYQSQAAKAESCEDPEEAAARRKALVPVPEVTEAVQGKWPWLDAARSSLSAAAAALPSLYALHLVYKAGEKLVDDSEDEEDDEEDEGWEYDDDDDDEDEDEDDYDDIGFD